MKEKHKILCLSMIISAILVVAFVMVVSNTILAEFDKLESNIPKSPIGGGFEEGIQKEHQYWINVLVFCSAVGFVVSTLIFYFVINWIKECKRINNTFI